MAAGLVNRKTTSYQTTPKLLFFLGKVILGILISAKHFVSFILVIISEDATKIDWAVVKNCDFITVGQEFSRKPFAVAVRDSSPLKDEVSAA